MFNDIFAIAIRLDSDGISSTNIVKVEKNHYLLYYDSACGDPSSWFNKRNNITTVVNLIKEKERKRRNKQNHSCKRSCKQKRLDS